MDAFPTPHTNGTPTTAGPDFERFVPKQSYLSGSKIGYLVRQFIRETGPSVTFEQTLDYLWKEHNTKCRHETFDRNYAQAFGPKKVEAATEPRPTMLPLPGPVEMDIPDEPLPPGHCRLRRRVRAAVRVHQVRVGGLRRGWSRERQAVS